MVESLSYLFGLEWRPNTFWGLQVLPLSKTASVLNTDIPDII